MRPFWKNRRFWTAVAFAGGTAALLVLAAVTLPRSFYYLERANSHADLETRLLAKLQERARDRQVLQTVLLRVLKDTTDSASASDPVSPNAAVVVHGETTIGPFEDWFNPRVVPGAFLPRSVAADLQRRNREGPVPLAEFTLQSRQIVIDDLNQLGLDALEKYPDGQTFVRVSLPGYSEDGKIALVAVSIAFDQHGSGEVFALELSNEKWRVAGSDLRIRE
jgi:hypothetical protein